MSMPGILVTTIKNKERAAEKDMIELLERVSLSVPFRLNSRPVTNWRVVS
jgi:hypothetical protein